MNSRNASKKIIKKGFFQRLALSIGIFAALILVIWLASHFLALYESNYNPAQDPLILNAQIFLAVLSSLLLVILLAQYLENLMAFKSNFTLALVILAITLLAYSITSNPLFFSYFGHEPMHGPFAVIPAIFTVITLLILLYLNNQ